MAGSTAVDQVPPAATGACRCGNRGSNGEASALLGGYSYINPESGWGGTWGGVVDGVLNVTVKDVWLDEGIEDAFVVVDTGTTEGTQGYTNWLGQISFLVRTLMASEITAWKRLLCLLHRQFDAENDSSALP